MISFKIALMSLCITLTLVAFPAKGAPDRDFNVIVNFEADSTSYQANTVQEERCSLEVRSFEQPNGISRIISVLNSLYFVFKHN